MRTSAAGHYLAIADELERDLRRDGLVPGAPVPSTRAIVRRWGVAMATASNVLRELSQRGLVQSRPGRGTVVTGGRLPAASPAPGPGPLTHERIIQAGIAIADREGLDAVSIRRLAAALQVAPMALYRHVATKEALVVEMLDRVYATWCPPDPLPRAWRDRVEAALREFWAACLRHPWIAPATSMTRPQVTPGVLPFADFVLAALAERGSSADETMTAYLVLLNFARGMAITLESEQEQQAATGVDNESWIVEQEAVVRAVLQTADVPTFRRFVSTPYDFDLSRIFDFGLARLLDGLERRPPSQIT